MPNVMPTLQEFADYIGVPLDEDGLANNLAVAGSLVDQFIVSAFREVPQSIYSNEVLRTAHAVYKQSETVGGSQQVVTLGEVTTNRFSRDPLSASYPVLRKYVLPF